MKKLMMITLITGMLFVGCGAEEQLIDNGGINPESNQVEKAVDEEVTEVEKKEYDMVGEIIEFGQGEIHVLTGDIVEIYKVAEEAANNFYLGETIALTLNGEIYDVESFIVEDFSIRFNTMGERIDSVTGEVIDSTENLITVKDGELEMSFETQNPLFAEVGNMVTIDYLVMGENKYFMAIYNETNKITKEVIAINRGEDGSFVVSFGDEAEVSHIGTLNNSVLNFNMSELKVGDEVDLYVEVMALSYPAQMAPKKATKVNNLD